MRALVILAAGLALAGCGAVEDGRAIMAARSTVGAELRDPGRAIYSGEVIAGGGTVCGYVNAPNGFGGMAGARRFVVVQGERAVLEENNPALVRDLWRLAGCEQ